MNRSKGANYQPSRNSNKIQGKPKGLLSSNNSMSKKKFGQVKVPQKGARSRAKHFDLTIPIPQKSDSKELDDTTEDYEQSIKGPYISCRTSQQVSRQNSPNRTFKNQQKVKQYRKELDNAEVNQQGSPLRRMEQTGFTGGSNYASITSKNYKNGK